VVLTSKVGQTNLIFGLCLRSENPDTHTVTAHIKSSTSFFAKMVYKSHVQLSKQGLAVVVQDMGLA